MKKYLIIEWLDKQPIINGANFYEKKHDAVKAALYLEDLVEKSNQKIAISVKYTICEIYEGKVP